MDDEREPDLSEDPRQQDEGQGGYPEDDPTGTGGGGEDRSGSGGASAPDSDSARDEDAGDATGNPDAAGG
jgi:hypothetical protein